MLRPVSVGPRVALLLALVLPHSLDAQSANDVVFVGLVGNGGSGHPAIAWNGAEWLIRDARERIAIDTPVVVVDTLGKRLSASVQDQSPYSEWMYRLVGVDELVNVQPFTVPDDVAYFASIGVDHAPFLPIPSPLSLDEWEALFPDAQSPPTRLDVRVWSASVGSHSLTLFVADRRATNGCVVGHHFGWFAPGDSQPTILEGGNAECLESHGRPFALVVRDGRSALVAGFFDSEAGAVELWEIVDGRLQRKGAESHS